MRPWLRFCRWAMRRHLAAAARWERRYIAARDKALPPIPIDPRPYRCPASQPRSRP
jgi:hypothetical protein